MKDVELEVFRADTKASRGITSADIAKVAEVYDPAKAPAHICIGHPKSDTPAYGRIEGLRAEGSRLFAKLKDVGNEVVEGIRTGKLVNRSMAFFHKDHEANPVPGTLYPRHLGFLGASAPGIPGLSNIKKALAFSADDEDLLEVDGDPAPAVMFESPREPTPVFSVSDKEPPVTEATEKTADQLEADRKALDKDRLAFEAERTKAREDANAATVDSLVAAGKVLPANADSLKLVFNALSPEPIEFEAGKDKRGAASELAAILNAGPKVVDTDGKPLSPTDTFTAKAEDKDDPAKIEAAARKLMENDKSLTFEAAVEQVTTGA
jgi:hypothetical protein